VQRRDQLMLGVCFLVSGATSLLLEVAWSKELSYVLGNTLYAVSTVVAAFMAGLGIGSVLAGRHAERFANPIRTYAVLQLAIAACGIGLVHVLRGTDPLFAALYRALAAAPGAFLLARFAVVFLLLLVPTTLMGMTLPVIVGAFSRRERTYDDLAGLLYGVNTVGAVAGTLLGGFLILPGLGLWKSCLLAGLLDGAVALIAILLARRVGTISDVRAAGDARRDRARPGWTGTQWWIASLYGISGLVALLLEVAWFRLLSLTLGPSVYAFAAMLGVYLAGVGLGSAIFASPVARARRPGLQIMAGLESLLGAVSLAQLLLYNALPGLFMHLFRSMAGSLGTGGFAPSFLLVSGLVVFLPCLIMGALFPAAVRAVREAGRELTPEGHVGRLYMLNTAGGITGSLLTGFWLIPTIGVWNTLILAGLASVVIGALLILRAPTIAGRPRTGYIAATIAAGVALAIVAPAWDVQLYNLGLYQHAYGPGDAAEQMPADEEMIYFRDGINAPVAVYRTTGNVTLYVSGKPDASMGGPDLFTQLLNGHLPVSFCAHPKRVAMVGYGSGMTAAGILAHPEVERLDVIEIEQAVLDASPYFAPINGNPERDPRTRLLLEDGRIHLKYADQAYDVITSEPSNPWMAGIANLFTADFYRSVRSRLTPGGIFAQWIQEYDISEETFRAILGGLQDAFPHVILFRTAPGDFMVMASDRPISIPWDSFRARFERASAGGTYRRIGIRHPLQLGFFFQGPEAALRELTRGTRQRNTDDNVWLEYRLPRELMSHAAVGAGTEFGSKVIAAGACARLSALQEMLPGVPVPDLVRETIAYPHGLEPDPTAPVVSADMWRGTRQVLAQGLATELNRGGRADLAAAAIAWDRQGDERRTRNERLTLELREPGRQALLPDPALVLRAVEAAPELPYVQLTLGQMAVAAGEEAEAEEALRRAVAEPSGYAHFAGLIALARLAARRDQLDVAQQYCRQAIDWNPYYPRAFALLAQLQGAAGQAAAAAATVRQGLHLNPNDPELERLAARAPSPAQRPT